MLCGLEMVPWTVRQEEAELEVADAKMLHYLMEVTTMDKIIINMYEEQHLWAE